MIRKKIILLTAFNSCLFFYFYSLYEIKLTQEARRESTKIQTQRAIEFPTHLSQIELADWGGELAANLVQDFSQWLALRSSVFLEHAPEGESLIRVALKNIENGHIERPYSEVSKAYLSSIETLAELVNSRRWSTLQSLAEQLPRNVEQIDYEASEKTLEQILETTLSSSLSQTNKELVLNLAAQTEKELLEHRILREQFESWQWGLVEAKKLARLGGQTHISSLERSPFESSHLFLSGLLLFLIMNSWILHSDLKVVRKNVFTISLKDAALDILKIVSTRYQGKPVPYRVADIKNGKTLLSRKIKTEIANDLFCIQQSLSTDGKIVFDELNEQPHLKLTFVSPRVARQETQGLSPALLRTDKMLHKVGGEVSLEAEFDDEGEAKTVEVIYRLPEASQLAASV